MDFFDWLNLIAVSLIFLRLIATHQKQREAYILGFIFCLLLIIQSANRVVGYPIDKYDIFEIGLFLTELVFIGLILLRGKISTSSNKVIIACVLLINLWIPVVVFPSIWLRQTWIQKSTKDVISLWRPHSLITKVTDQHIFVVQTEKLQSGIVVTHVLDYYWPRNTPPAFFAGKNLPVSATTSNQKLNQPYSFILKMLGTQKNN